MSKDSETRETLVVTKKNNCERCDGFPVEENKEKEVVETRCPECGKTLSWTLQEKT